jgi:two-component system, response regulator PdtaR
MLRVLICEDHPLLAVDLADIIAEAGHTVCGSFESGAEALACARDLKPDLAIIDLYLTDGATGGAIAQAIQQMGVRVVILSGHSNAGAEFGGFPHTFAQKPITKSLVQNLLSFAAATQADMAPC